MPGRRLGLGSRLSLTLGRWLRGCPRPGWCVRWLSIAAAFEATAEFDQEWVGCVDSFNAAVWDVANSLHQLRWAYTRADNNCVGVDWSHGPDPYWIDFQYDVIGNIVHGVGTGTPHGTYTHRCRDPDPPRPWSMTSRTACRPSLGLERICLRCTMLMGCGSSEPSIRPIRTASATGTNSPTLGRRHPPRCTSPSRGNLLGRSPTIAAG